MIFEDNWLKETYDTYVALEFTEAVRVVSPFHCYHLNGAIANGKSIKEFNHGGKSYEIKNNVSGNTWFMTGKTWTFCY